MANPNPQNYNCPQCGQVDRVEKVSALLRAGTSAGLYSGTASGSGLVAGMSYTALSQKLSPPIEPIYQSPWGGCSVTITAGLVIWNIAFIVWVCLGLSQSPTVVEALSHGNLDYWRTFIIIIGVGLIGWVIMAAIISTKNRTASERGTHFATEYPRWERAIARWNELYYCSRNDVVFIPGKPNTCVPINEMQKLLYRP